MLVIVATWIGPTISLQLAHSISKSAAILPLASTLEIVLYVLERTIGTAPWVILTHRSVNSQARFVWTRSQATAGLEGG
jgi:hypothetical protein